MATFQIQAVTGNEPTTGRDIGLKMEMLLTIRSTTLLLFDRVSEQFHNESVLITLSLCNSVHKHTSV
jgi:hypothetical protein